MPPAQPFRPDRILVLSLAGIGDTLQATPILRELRLQFPNARMDVAVLWAGSAQILEGNPNIHSVHQSNLIQDPRTRSIAFLLRLRAQRYDLSLTLHPQGRREYRIVSRIIGARRRLSHQYENQSWIDRWLVTDSIPQDYSVSGAENNLRLLAPLGLTRRVREPVLELFLTESESRWAAQWEAGQDLAGRAWLGVHVGSGGTKNLALRRWPITRWIQFCLQFARTQPNVPIVAFGGPGEAEVHRELLQNLPPGLLRIAESPGLRHAAALVGRARAFLSVDTAFMHIAAAMRVPHQYVIETPTLNPPVEPLRPDWIRIPNPAVAGRSLDFYRYDGRPIAGTPDELVRVMESVTPDAVLQSLSPAFKAVATQ